MPTLEGVMVAQVLVLLFVAGLIATCVALLRSSSKQKRLWQPDDLRRADDAERGEPYEPKKAVRAAQDASNWGSPGF
jgi:hypothetical protein